MISKRHTLNTFSFIIGLDIINASRRLKAVNYTLRVVRKDGDNFIVTMDFCSNRINVSVKNDVIVELLSIG